VTDCLGLCYFTTQWYDPDLLGPADFAALLEAATGRSIEPAELLEIGDRIHNVGKAFNTRHAGFGRADDRPVARFFDEPIASGVRAGTRLDRERWEALLSEYYAAKGWDPASGHQTRRRLYELGLADVADDLRRDRLLVGEPAASA
jgi:aldehyde:ferredoxin oxidoreductase